MGRDVPRRTRQRVGKWGDMDLLGRKRKLRRQAEGAVVAARRVEEWLSGSEDADPGDTDSGETARRWRESGRLDPDAAKDFAAWYRGGIRTVLGEATSGAVASQEIGSGEQFERSWEGITAAVEEFQALTRWLKAEGYE